MGLVVAGRLPELECVGRAFNDLRDLRVCSALVIAESMPATLGIAGIKEARAVSERELGLSAYNFGELALDEG